MKKYLMPLLLGMILGGLGFFVLSSSGPEATAVNLKLDEQEATVRAIKSAVPAVVNISVYDKVVKLTMDPLTGTTSEKIIDDYKGSGTGFVISSDGLILTNKHVISAGSDKAIYKVTLSNKERYFAQLIGKDPLNDLAVLKVYDKKLPFLKLGDSSKMPVGATVLAIGNALGKYQNSVTKGIVSAVGRNIEASDPSGDFESLSNLIQTDAQVNQGNSGGPLLDLEGKVVGVNVAIDMEGGSISFAIPIDDAKPVIKSVMESGRIKRPRLGLRYLMIDPEAVRERSLPRESGALVIEGSKGEAAVVPGSPAEKAGIAKGDIIIEANGIKLEGSVSLSTIIQKLKAGDKVKMKLFRTGSVIEKIVVLDEFK